MLPLRFLSRASYATRRPLPVFLHGYLKSGKLSGALRKWNSSISKAEPELNYVNFPGAQNSRFTTKMEFELPSSMPTFCILDQDGLVLDKNRNIDITDMEAVKIYKDMLTVSMMDPVMFDAQRQGRLSFYLVSAGEEGISVGSASALHPSDVIFAQYRESGVYQQRGFTLDDFMNQLFSNRKDPGRGRNMPVHYGSRKLNIHTISSTLATQIPHAAGAAYAIKLQNTLLPLSSSSQEKAVPRVVACYFGEGAASEGDFHAALNIAATRSCPVVFVCRNNGYAISTPTLEQYRGDGIASRGVGYGIKSIRVDGNDVLAVREVTKEARRMALEDGGRPILIEAMSYRVHHHSTSDDSFAYRGRVEVEKWKTRDNPISRMRKWLQDKGLWNEDKEVEERSRISKEIREALLKAEKEKKPPVRCMFEDVYEDLTEEQIEQMNRLKDMMKKYPDEYNIDEFEEGL